MSEKLGIIEKYNQEILDIETKLKDLENGRIYELTGVQGDGSLATNAVKLRKMFRELLYKIEYQKDSILDEFDQFLE
jgi:hypothetical protein